MQKNPITTEDQTQEFKPKKQKKNKHPTACIDKTKSILNCGHCGSENIIWSGVDGCETCGSEKHYIIEGYSWWTKNWDDSHIDCNCKNVYVNGHWSRYR